MIKEVLLVGAGGFAGSALRFLISTALLSVSARTNFPIGTFLVNVAGSLLIGLLIAVMPDGGWRQLCIAGFCGGFTTFSAFSLESFGMLREGQYLNAGIYIAASVAVCILFVWLGLMIGDKFLKTI